MDYYLLLAACSSVFIHYIRREKWAMLRRFYQNELIEAGCERILTSGQQLSAPDGIDLIAQLNTKANHRIIIMPGSGVRKENIKMLADKTGCTEFHSSLRGKEKSKMEFIHSAFRDSEESCMNHAVEPDEVRALRAALDN